MNDETGEGAEGVARAKLAPGTFRACGATSKSSETIAGSELIAIADLLDPVYRQTALPFCWVTGARAQEDVTAEAVDRFCAVMQRIDRRFGSHPAHLNMTVEDAIASAESNGARPRDHSTIVRHRGRLARIRSYPRPQFEDRVRGNGWIELTTSEAALVDGADKHRGYMLVEQLGEIKLAIALKTFDLMTKSRSSKDVARMLIQEAADVVAVVPNQGRAFIATRHDGFYLLIQRFWNAL